MYNWEYENSKLKHSSHQYDPKSSFFNKFKTHHSKSHQNEDFKPKTPKKTPPQDEKMSSLRRACLVEKWMDKKVTNKVIARGERKSSSRSSSTTLIEEFDLQDALFFSSSTTNSTSSSSSEIEYSVFSHPKQKPKVTCFAPPRPKPIKTRTIESKFLNQFSEEEEKDADFIKNRSKAANFYSNLKNLKQPISPGVRLTSFINSLFTKDGKNSKKSNIITKQGKKTEESRTTSSSTCSSACSFSRSCLSKTKKFQDDGSKRTVRFCPVSVIVDDDSQACGYKSLREEKSGNHLNTKMGRSLSKRYEELKKFNGLERENHKLQQQKKLEEVALDLLSGYWDARLNKSNDNDDNYGDNQGVNYDQNEDEDDDDDDDGGFSCSSSDLFELDHLSLIGNELPVYESTQFDNKIV
ncbi:hypothetical protein BVRB_2g034060 [Beta vulgaris subsp. vulgaris]|nr:hypothetical protein BVRB_2g034060 [Beta vulgaris subsp. vulgaris]